MIIYAIVEISLAYSQSNLWSSALPPRLYMWAAQLQANHTGESKNCFHPFQSTILLPDMQAGPMKANHSKLVFAPTKHPAGSIFCCRNVDMIKFCLILNTRHIN